MWIYNWIEKNSRNWIQIHPFDIHNKIEYETQISILLFLADTNLNHSDVQTSIYNPIIWKVIILISTLYGVLLVVVYNFHQYFFIKIQINSYYIYLYNFLRQIGTYIYILCFKTNNKIVICSQNFVSFTQIWFKTTTNRTSEKI
jgi:hypothetical protein